METGTVSAPFAEGSRIEGKYRLDACRAESDRDAVYDTVHSSSTGEKAARIRLIRADSPSEAAVLRGSVAAARILRHANLLPIYDCGEIASAGTNYIYVVSERPDEDLGGVLGSRALDLSETRQVLHSVLPALGFLHDRGWIHGDLRPSEVTGCGDSIKIAFDGIRRVPDLPYKPPETDAKSLGPAADAWGIAVLTLECLTRSPYPCGMDRLDFPFRDIVEGGLEPDPAARWSIARMNDALEGRAAPSSATVLTPAPAQARYRRFAGIAVGGALAAAAACVLLMRSAHQAPVPPAVTVEAPAGAAAARAAVPAAKAQISPSQLPAGWAVIGAAYHRPEDAQKRAFELRKTHPRLNPSVGSAGGRSFVLFGSGLSEAQAKRQLDRARRDGAPRDSYITRFRG